MSKSDSPEIVLCIPGMWANRSELVERIVKQSEGYLFAGFILHNMESHEFFELKYETRDEGMQAAFRAASPHWVNTPEMARISRHASVVYLAGPGGSVGNVQAIMRAANALLKAGGLGVKVDTTGIAHGPSAWREMCEEFQYGSAHRGFVLHVGGDREIYTCGMQNFGMKDVIAEKFDDDDTLELLRIFTRYMVVELPEILDGQTFKVTPDAPVYRIVVDPGVSYDRGSLFSNTYGFWRLVPQ